MRFPLTANEAPTSKAARAWGVRDSQKISCDTASLPSHIADKGNVTEPKTRAATKQSNVSRITPIRGKMTDFVDRMCDKIPYLTATIQKKVKVSAILPIFAPHLKL
jgi:hypothetical protein